MRLVVVLNMLAPYRVPLLNEVARHPGLRLTVLLAARSEPGRLWSWPSDVEFSAEIMPALMLKRGIRSPLYVAPSLIRDIPRLAADVVIAGGVSLSYPALVGARLSGARFFSWSEATLHGEQMQTPQWRWPVKGLVPRLADGCIAASSQAADYYRALGVDSTRIHVSLMPVDTETVRKQVAAYKRGRNGIAREDSRDIVFLHVGNLEYHKGVDLLMQAFLLARQMQPNMRLVFVGHGSLRSYLERQAAREAPGAVEFPGFASAEQVAQRYAQSDVFCLFSRREAFGAVVPEAMTAGLPVVVTKYAGSATDLIRDGVEGRLVDPLDTVECARILRDLALDAVQRRKMGLMALERARLCAPDVAAESILRIVGWSSLGTP